MDACGIEVVQWACPQAHCVLPDTLAQFRQRLDDALMNAWRALQAAAAREEGRVRPAHRLVDTLPVEQGSQRVTEATTLYKAQKKSSASSRPSRRKAPRTRPRCKAKPPRFTMTSSTSCAALGGSAADRPTSS